MAANKTKRAPQRKARASDGEVLVRPQARVLKEVVAYLEAIGLYVGGPNYNLETGDLHLGDRYYEPQDVIRYRYRWQNDWLGKTPVELLEDDEVSIIDTPTDRTTLKRSAKREGITLLRDE